MDVKGVFENVDGTEEDENILGLLIEQGGFPTEEIRALSIVSLSKTHLHPHLLPRRG